MSVIDDEVAPTRRDRALADSAAAPPAGALRTWWRSRFGARLPVEILIVVVVYQGYKWARRLTSDHYEAAFRNADLVAALQRRLGLLVEDDLQRFALDVPGAIWFLNRYYAYVHFTCTLVTVVWLYARHVDLYARIRRVLVGTTLVALVVHIAFPLAPPRMLPEMGFVDTVTVYGPRIYQNPSVAGVVNQIAAMPSLHFGWAVIVAWAVVRALRTRWRWLALAHPTITLAAIVLTANHWWLDAAVAGAIVAAVAVVDQRVVQRPVDVANS